MLGVDELRNAREDWTVVYTDFLREYDRTSNRCCYGFVEGKDDPSYYMTLITNQLSPGYKIRLFPSGNKKNVCSIYKRINWKNRRVFPKNRIVFFMDRDLSDLVRDTYILKKNNVYITDKYSIENDMVNRDTCESILREVLGFSQTKQEKLDSVLDIFEKTKEHFENIMKPVMAHIVFWKRNNIDNPNYNNVKVKDILRIDLCRICLLKNQSAMIEYIYKQSNVDINILNINDIQKIEEEIAPICSQIIRGKYIASFFILFCQSISRDKDRLNLKKTDKGCLMGEIDMMHKVAPRCRLPESLKQFIENTLLKYIKSLK